ncbi:hypothetical protein Tco_1526309, partial [Tanacetum coccineum]
NSTFVEPFNLVEPIKNQAPPIVTMDDTRTMAQLLEAPTAGYEDAIVVPEITADNFELKHDHFYDEVLERPEYVGKAYAFLITSDKILSCPEVPTIVVISIGTRTPIVTSQMTDLLALITPGSAWTFVVIVAFYTQGQ